MYYSRKVNGISTYDIFMMTYSGCFDSWGQEVEVMGVNTSDGNERRPVVTGDGLTMYAIIGERPNLEIGVATRPSVTAPFTSLTPVPVINSSSNDEIGTIVPDNSAIWFSSNRSGNYEIYRAPRSGTQFGPPVLVSSVSDSSALDSNPVLTPDELTLYFASNRAGSAGASDIWIAKRASITDEFDAPVNVRMINSQSQEIPLWISADGCDLYIGLSVDLDMYVWYLAERRT